MTLIWGYMAYRLRVGQWLADYVNESVWERALMNTGILIFSSWILHQFWTKKRNALFLFGMLSGVLFLHGQWNLWLMLLDRGLTFNNSIAGSFLYLLTAFHAIHVVIALLILLPLGIQFAVYEKNQLRFQLALQFWDLLLVFWLMLLFLIFVFK